jgi:hypothetical protein
MSLRTRLLIIIGAIILVGGIIAGILVIRSRSHKPAGEGAENQTQNQASTNSETAPLTGQAPTTIPAGLPIKQMSAAEAEQNGVKQLGRIFVERYGTYSTDNQGQNIQEVKGLVTPELWQKIAPKSTTPATDFVGVTTQVVTMDVSTFSASEAKLSFRTVRTQLKGGQTTSTQQAITLTMVKKDANWLVSDFAWQK